MLATELNEVSEFDLAARVLDEGLRLSERKETPLTEDQAYVIAKACAASGQLNEAFGWLAPRYQIVGVVGDLKATFGQYLACRNQFDQAIQIAREINNTTLLVYIAQCQAKADLPKQAYDILTELVTRSFDEPEIEWEYPQIIYAYALAGHHSVALKVFAHVFQNAATASESEKPFKLSHLDYAIRAVSDAGLAYEDRSATL